MLTTVLASIALAAGADWTATFGPNQTGTYLDGDHSKVLVAAAGDPASQAKEAAAALVAALRQSGRADLVMTSESLGDVAALDDQSIVKRAAALPVTRVAVVRVFPGATDQPLTAVVSFYDKAGTTTGALSAMAGQPLAARTGAGQNEGVSNQAVSAVSGIQKEAVAASKKVTEEYDLKYIGFTPLGFPIQGKYQKRLEGAAFYAELERTDLVAKYNANEAVRWTLMIGGVGAAGFGLLAPTLFQSSLTELVVPVTILLLGGTGAWMIGYLWNPNPVTPDEARKLADDHNIKLREKLGLPPPHASLEIGDGRIGLRLSGNF